MTNRHFLFILGLILFTFELHAQNAYVMSNQTVTDCEGILTDSEANEDFPGYYEGGENFTFTICVDNAETITIRFTGPLQIEEDFDFLSFYEGADTTGNLIATFTGSLPPVIPPNIVLSNNDCITIHFVSDDNVELPGWSLEWEVETQEPDPVDMTLVGTYSCEDPSMIISLSDPVLCDSLTNQNVSIVGPGNVGIVDVRPIDCQNGFADQFEIIMNPVIAVGGNYQIRLISYVIDACDEIYELISSVDLLVDDCPLSIILEAEGVCPGDCTQLSAEVIGGDGNFTFDWIPSAPDQSTIQICPNRGDTIYLTVMDGSGESASVSYVPLIFPTPRILNLPSDTLCRSYGRIDLVSDIPGGTWSAQGIHPNNARNGRYETWRTNTNPIFEDIITYTDTNGCVVDTQLTILYITPGSNDGACIGAPAFRVSGGLPNGGYWTGMHIDSSGIFDPSVNGNFPVTYHATNGCTWSKTVFVRDSVSFNGPDTICNTSDNFRIIPNPRGGLWDANPFIGRGSEWVNVSRTSPGENTLIYRAEGGGCIDTFRFFVKQIFIDQDTFKFCPEAIGNTIMNPFTPSIPGGTWAGPQILVDSSGLIDAQNATDGDAYNMRYTADGCYVDGVVAFESTVVEIVDQSIFCRSDEAIDLIDLVDIWPVFATVSGTGLFQDSLGNTLWDPSLIPGDSFVLTVSARGCSDEVILYLNDIPEIIEDQACSLDDAFNLSFNTSINSVNGPGIVFSDIGLFDPSQVDTGMLYFDIESSEGCLNMDSLFMTGIVEPEILNLASIYCYKDTVINLQASPMGGSLFIDDVLQSSFNPTMISSGSHIVEYIYGAGNCEASDRVSFLVSDPLNVDADASADTLCPGELVRISASPSGGLIGADYEIDWGSQLGFGQVHYVSPPVPSSYIVSLSDGCSETVFDTLDILLHNDFTVSLNYGPRVCAGEETYVELNTTPSGNYNYLVNGLVSSDVYYDYPGLLDIVVTNASNGCIKRLNAELPGYGPIGASYIKFPAGCIQTNDDPILISDQSNGSISGSWFLNGQFYMDYTQGDQFEIQFDSAGLYNLMLIVENEGECMDTFAQDICVEPFYSIHVPNAFTPNGDDVNDEFRIHTIGIESITWRIFDRYGKLVFESNNLNGAWDGAVDGEPGKMQNYMMVANYTTETGISESKKFNIMLVR